MYIYVNEDRSVCLCDRKMGCVSCNWWPVGFSAMQYLILWKLLKRETTIFPIFSSSLSIQNFDASTLHN